MSVLHAICALSTESCLKKGSLNGMKANKRKLYFAVA